jgi:hypothetical protein
MALLFCERENRRTIMRPPGFDADPHPLQTPALDPPVPPPGGAAAQAAPADAGLNEEDEERTIEEPGYGHGV